MNPFETAFGLLIDREGALSLDHNDRGNWTSGQIGVGSLRGTKYGISAMSYPTLDIANLTLAAAQAIYKRDFWDRVQGDRLAATVAFQAFDAAVNSGLEAASKWLQMAASVPTDGDIGDETVAAVEALSPVLVTARFNAYRLLAMTTMSGWPLNSRGWARRVANNVLAGAVL
jgi:lysozyme family protein